MINIVGTPNIGKCPHFLNFPSGTVESGSCANQGANIAIAVCEGFQVNKNNFHFDRTKTGYP